MSESGRGASGRAVNCVLSRCEAEGACLERERKREQVCVWRKERDKRHHIHISKLMLITLLVSFSFNLTSFIKTL